MPRAPARILNELLAAFRKAGWVIQGSRPGPNAPNTKLVLNQDGISYAVHIKHGSEGRSDRLIPLWAQAYLEAMQAAAEHQVPLAIVVTRQVPEETAAAILRFASEYGPDAAAGVADATGFRAFRGPQLERLNAPGTEPAHLEPKQTRSGNLFTDLNQWMLKVLLAPQIPDDLLQAPRGKYRTATDLAGAADVSIMSASRLLRILRREGHLDEARDGYRLVRRRELLSAWEAASRTPVKEGAYRLVLPGDPVARLQCWFDDRVACLALYAAADALGLGHVSGVPTHAYLLPEATAEREIRPPIRPAEPGEPVDVLLRQPPFVESLRRGAVVRKGVWATDVIQTWLDVGTDPSRGREQARQIWDTALAPLVADS